MAQDLLSTTVEIIKLGFTLVGAMGSQWVLQLLLDPFAFLAPFGGLDSWCQYILYNFGDFVPSVDLSAIRRYGVIGTSRRQTTSGRCSCLQIGNDWRLHIQKVIFLRISTFLISLPGFLFIPNNEILALVDLIRLPVGQRMVLIVSIYHIKDLFLSHIISYSYILTGLESLLIKLEVNVVL